MAIFHHLAIDHHQEKRGFFEIRRLYRKIYWKYAAWKVAMSIEGRTREGKWMRRRLSLHTEA